MKKFMTAIMALTFVTGLGISTASFAEKLMGAEITAACKDKKPGDTVKIDGKDVKCPAPAKDKK